MGTGTYSHAGSTYRHQNADDLALERLVAITGGVKVSAHVPAVVSNKQYNVIRLGMRRDMVAPIWEGVTLIPDEVTKACERADRRDGGHVVRGENPADGGLLQATVRSCIGPAMASVLLSGSGRGG